MSEAGRVEPNLARLNQALYEEFVRVTGATSLRDFGNWYHLERARAQAAVPPGPQLTAAEEAALVLGRSSALPPASWPSIDLVGA